MKPETKTPDRVQGSRRADLRRFFNPKSVALVGASEGQSRSDNIARTLFDAGVEVHLINPARPQAYGRETLPTLSSAPAVDAVISLVNAARSIEVVKDAAAQGAGGVVVIAGGFREAGAEGQTLEDRLVAGAGKDLFVCGPNCNGFINARRGIRLCGSPPIPVRPGSIGFVTHSGGFIAFAMLAARERVLGFSYLFSAGNEAQLDIVDYLDFLVDDAETRVICLVIERIDRPDAFSAAVRRAREAGKPVIAMRLAKGARARAIAQSHTGAIVGDGGAVDAAMASLGIISVGSLDEMLDAAVCFEQIEARRWRPVKGVAVLTASGGAAAMASDFLEGQGIPLPPLQDLVGSVSELSEATMMNPLDLTGFVIGRPELLNNVLVPFLAHPDVNVIVLLRELDDHFRKFGGAVFDCFVDAAQSTDKVLILSSIIEARIGDWVEEIPDGTVARTRGLRGLATGLRALNTYARTMTSEPRPLAIGGPTIDRPAAKAVSSPAGPILPFEAAMSLLKAIGIAVADFHIIPASDDPAIHKPKGHSLSVLKVADAAHRTEIGGVRLGISPEVFTDAVADLRSRAAANGVSGDVVVQPQLLGTAEAFIGFDRNSAFGPIVVCGVGGINVELNQARAARLAPISRSDALAMLEEIDAKAGVLTRHRGRVAWEAEQMIEALLAVGSLAAAPWVESLDINPLVMIDGAPVAVDALCIVKADNDRE